MSTSYIAYLADYFFIDLEFNAHTIYNKVIDGLSEVQIMDSVCQTNDPLMFDLLSLFAGKNVKLAAKIIIMADALPPDSEGSYAAAVLFSMCDSNFLDSEGDKLSSILVEMEKMDEARTLAAISALEEEISGIRNLIRALDKFKEIK